MMNQEPASRRNNTEIGPNPTSRLLNLPAELRNIIYGLVIQNSLAHTISIAGECRIPALLNVCKRIREEATQLHYATNSFRAIVSDDQYNGPVIWLSSLGPKAAASIAKLTVEYTISSPVRDIVGQFANAVIARDREESSRLADSVFMSEECSFREMLQSIVKKGIKPAVLHFEAAQAVYQKDMSTTQHIATAVSRARMAGWEVKMKDITSALGQYGSFHRC